jgi:hypothetical protein
LFLIRGIEAAQSSAVNDGLMEGKEGAFNRRNESNNKPSRENERNRRKVRWGDTATVRFYDPSSTTPLVEEIHQDVIIKVDHSNRSIFY